MGGDITLAMDIFTSLPKHISHVFGEHSKNYVSLLNEQMLGDMYMYAQDGVLIVFFTIIDIQGISVCMIFCTFKYYLTFTSE